MSIRLNIGDAVLVQMKKNEKIIGLIKVNSTIYILMNVTIYVLQHTVCWTNGR